MRRSTAGGRCIVLYANDLNVGDYLSGMGIVEMVKGVDRSIAFEKHRPLAGRILKGLGPDDLVIVGGGGLLKSTFDPFWRFLMALATERGFHCALWGVGYCDVKGQTTRGDSALLTRVVEGSIIAGLRDPMSHSPFADFAHASVVVCPAVHYVRTLVAQPPTKTRLLRVDHPQLITELFGDNQSEAHARLRELSKTTADRSGLALDVTNNMIDAPSKWAPARARARVAPTRRAARRTRTKAHDLVARYGAAELVITTRLHGAILATALGAKVIALSADHKIDEYFRLLDIERWVVDDLESLEEAIF